MIIHSKYFSEIVTLYFAIIDFAVFLIKFYQQNQHHTPRTHNYGGMVRYVCINTRHAPNAGLMLVHRLRR